MPWDWELHYSKADCHRRGRYTHLLNCSSPNEKWRETGKVSRDCHNFATDSHKIFQLTARPILHSFNNLETNLLRRVDSFEA